MDLVHPDNLYFDAAVGWLMLGDALAAQEELDRMSATARSEPEVLELEWSICAEIKRWDRAFEVAERIVSIAPNRTFGWIHRAFAARRMAGGGLARAWEVLRPAADKFPEAFLVSYNLACYAAQMGRPEEAWEWLQRALAKGGDQSKVRQMALSDPDLEVLWPRLAAER